MKKQQNKKERKKENKKERKNGMIPTRMANEREIERKSKGIKGKEGNVNKI